MLSNHVLDSAARALRDLERASHQDLATCFADGRRERSSLGLVKLLDAADEHVNDMVLEVLGCEVLEGASCDGANLLAGALAQVTQERLLVSLNRLAPFCLCVFGFLSRLAD